MLEILYLGTKQYNYSNVKSVIETLEPYFKQICSIKTSSNKQNQFIRMFDMLFSFFRYGLKADKIIIDVYSTRAFFYALFFGLLSWFFKKKYILFLHGGNLPWRYKQNPRIVSLLFRYANSIIAPSNYLALYFCRLGFDVKIIPNIIDINNYSFLERFNLRPKILCLRGFGKPYNPLMTLRAAKLLKDQNLDLKILMIGSKDEFYYDEVINFISNNSLNDIVEISEKISKEEWIYKSQNYDIMVSNPDIDNTPVSLIEGMALGMCVISTSVGGVPFLFSDLECSFIPKNDHAALASRINSLLINRDFANKLSKSGRRKAEEFDWKKIKELWINVFYT